MQTIKQPDTKSIYPYTVKVKKDDDDDLVIVRGEGNGFDEAEVVLDTHRARQLYNAIGEEMGFSKETPPRQSKPTPKGAQAYKGNGKHKWELVTADAKGAGHTYRLRVSGGWLYRTVTTAPATHHGVGDGDPISVTQSFVPVPDAVGYAV